MNELKLNAPSSPKSPSSSPASPTEEKQEAKKHHFYRKFDQNLYDEEEKENQKLYDRLFEGNKKYVEEKTAMDNKFFEKLSVDQKPTYLLIGCSDARVPPDQLFHIQPGDMFIHRNVANLVVHTDMNISAVLQYAVRVLKVKHIIVLGHYGCGGVKASLENKSHGIIDKWLKNIKDIYRIYRKELDLLKNDPEKQHRLLVEINVKEQVLNLCKTAVIQRAWANGSHIKVHGIVYDLKTGYIKDLKIRENDWKDIEPIYKIDFD